MQNTATILADIGTDIVGSKKAENWTWALALVRAAGGSPSDNVLALAEREIRGEITTADIKEFLDGKYMVKERD